VCVFCVRVFCVCVCVCARALCVLPSTALKASPPLEVED
jgi:hypothetical protein